MSNQKRAFFDFDGTLVDFDTVNSFIRFVLAAHPELDVEPDTSLPHKQYRLKLLAGLGACELDALAGDYYRTKVRPFLIEESVARLEALRADGYDVSIISGSYDLYLRFFCREMGIDNLICTEVAFRNEEGVVRSLSELNASGVALDGFECMGVFRFLDCLGENKLQLMEKKMGRSDYRESDSVAFSDSATDLPLLRACQNAVVVAPRGARAEPWMEESGFEILGYRYPLRRKLFRKLCYYGRKLAGVSS